MKKYIAEFIGTFALIFCGTGAIMLDQATNGSLGLLGIAIAFGGIVTAMIYSFGLVSGAHINPVVTIGFWIGRSFEGRKVLGYLLAQFSGAILASYVLTFFFPGNSSMGATMPSGSELESFMIEIVFTFVLLFTIVVVSSNKRTAHLTGVVVGIVLIGIIMITGPISGGSFNPARSIAPVLFSGNYTSLWIYMTAPFIGGVGAVLLWKLIKPSRNH